MPVDNDRHVYRKFMEGDASREIALLAFTPYAEAKFDWPAQDQARQGSAPTAIEIERWIRDQWDPAHLDLKVAIAYFDEAATVYMANQIAAERSRAVDLYILSEVASLLFALNIGRILYERLLSADPLPGDVDWESLSINARDTYCARAIAVVRHYGSLMSYPATDL